MKYSVILFLLLCELSFGQIPGNPKIMSTRNFPTVYTLSYTPTAGASSADVTAQVINTGLFAITESGILWGTGSVDIDTYTGKISTGDITGQPFTMNVSPLPESGSISIVAYAKTQQGTFYGKVITIPQQKVRSPFTNKTWMTYNVGATAIANVNSPRGDVDSYGYLYQWGRGSDGHQIILPLKSATYDVNRIAISGSAFSAVSGSTLANYNSISSSFVSNGGDWLTTSRNDLWQGLNGLNNPCPTGFRVPTISEFVNEIINFSPANSVGALNSFLNLPAAGLRSSGGILGTGAGSYFNYDTGRYWTSTINTNTTARIVSFNSSTLDANILPAKSYGYSVRCIMGEATSGGSSILSYISTSYSTTGNMFPSIPISGVTQTITANVSPIGTYDISTNTVNGITFAGKGTFTGATGVKEIVLTASGTPLEPISSTFTLNTEPNNFFTRSVSPSSTNGTAVVDSYTLVGSTTGEMSSGNKIIVNLPSSIGAVVSQTITANVISTGSYNINAINNGVTFASSGTFTTTGPQNIVLTASGIPTSAGNYTFTSNTNPSAIFSNTTITGDPTSGGTATIDFTNSVTAGSPLTLTAAQDAENVRTLVYNVESSTYNPPFIAYRIVNVTKAGSYNLNISDNRDGVTLRLAGSGTFTTTGWQLMTLYYIGAPSMGTNLSHQFYFPSSTKYQIKYSN